MQMIGGAESMHHLKSRHQSKGQEAMMGDCSVTVEIHQEEVLVAQLLSEYTIAK